MLQGVEQTARNTTTLINAIKDLMLQVKHQLRSEQPKIYSQELINNLFRHPYTKINFVTQELGVHRNTARKYLEALVILNIVSKFKIGKDNYYLNHRLYDLLQQAGNLPSGDQP